MGRVLEMLGGRVQLQDNRLKLDPSGMNGHEAPYELVRTMRASIYALGLCLAKHGKAKAALPGGCAIGARPIDLHLKGISALGAQVKIEHGFVVAEAPRLKGTTVDLEGPHGSSVGATVNVLLAATAAQGVTVIENAAREPEVEDLVSFLKTAGADIEGGGTSRLVIRGKKPLKGVTYRVIPDRIEAGTYLVAAALAGSKVTVENCLPRHLEAVLEVLHQIGVSMEVGENAVCISGGGKRSPVDVRVKPYPGFPTDMQAQIMALLCLVPGISVIEETIWENRFLHALELNRMGADIRLKGRTAVVKGVAELTGAPVMASDLRASAALILAGLAAKGETVVDRIYHLDRGYERMEEKLSVLGAEISRFKE